MDNRTVKYIEALKELKELLNNPSVFRVSLFCKQKGIDLRTGSFLKDIGVLARKRIGASVVWVWIGKYPSVEMVERLFDEFRQRNKKYVETHRFKKKSSKGEFTVSVSRNIEFYEVKLLFNLITLRITPKYHSC